MPGRRQWFKHWISALMSDDLAALSDHEERVWWRLLAAASKRDDWAVVESPLLATLCASTPAKLHAAIVRLAELDMVTLRGSQVTITNWKVYQESPSAERMRRLRGSQHEPDVTSQKRHSDAHSDANVTRTVTSQGDAHSASRRTRSRTRGEENARADFEDFEDLLDGHDPGWRDRYGTLVTALGKPLDRRVADEFEQLADEYTLEQLQEAVRDCRRERKQTYSDELRKHLPQIQTRASNEPWREPEFVLPEVVR